MRAVEISTRSANPALAYSLKRRQSAWGLYVLFGAAVLLQINSVPGQTDYIGQYLPFFDALNTVLNTKGLSFSLAEIFMVLVLLVWLLRSLAAGKLNFDRGSLMRPVGLYMLMVTLGEFLGWLQESIIASHSGRFVPRSTCSLPIF